MSFNDREESLRVPGYTSIFSDVSSDRTPRFSSSLYCYSLFRSVVSFRVRLSPPPPRVTFLPSSCSSLSRRCWIVPRERHRYFPPVSQRQLTAAGRSPVPSCTAADKDPDGGRGATETSEPGPVSWLPGGSRLHRPCAGAAILSIPSVR